jgi:hypothetical protein
MEMTFPVDFGSMGGQTRIVTLFAALPAYFNYEKKV